MPELIAKLFGKPGIKIDGEKVEFPYKKVEALLYYILVNKKVSRSKAASLLWGSMIEKKAKKNLRNALYELKKSVSNKIVITPDRSTIKLNEECNLILDVDIFLAEENKKAIAVYKGEFLAEFALKDNIEFECWQMEQRNFYRAQYIEKLNRYIGYLYKKDKNEQAIQHLELLIKIDEFNENAYCQLIELYGKEGLIAKAVDTYQRLEKKLGEELSIQPNEKTKQTLRMAKNNKTISKKEEYICHKKQFNKLQNGFQNFMASGNNQSYIVFGEAGIGKTTLLNHVYSKVKKDKVLVFKTFCFQSEERFFLKPWKHILQELEDKIDLKELGLLLSWNRIVSHLFPALKEEKDVVKEMKLDSIESYSLTDTLIYLFSEIAKEYKLILIFEDLHWADKKTLLLIKNLIYSQTKNIKLAITSRNSGEKRINNVFSGLYKEKLLEKINLKRLSFSQIKEFAANYCERNDFCEKTFDKLNQETEGNVFFLVEYLNLLKQDKIDEVPSELTSRSKNILRNRIQYISQEARNILNLISIFFDKVSHDILVRLSNKSALELIKIIEELQDNYLIKQVDGDYGTPHYTFTHSKLREFIYNEQSVSRTRILHERIASILEKTINNYRRKDYTQLIYHYSQAGNKEKHLEYLIREAEFYFNYTHKLYPVARDRYLNKDNLLLIGKEDAQFYLNEINSLIEEIELERDKYKKYLVQFLHMRFYYLIGEGEYDLAVIHIRKMISEAEKINDLSSLIKGYEELAIIGIQIEDFDLLEKNARKLNEIADKTDQLVKKAIAKRLLGVFYLYRHDFRDANKLFQESLQLFEEKEMFGEKYTLSKATIYNYLGEVQRRNGKFSKACFYYKKAIKMCKKQNIISGLGTFYTNIGIATFHNNKEIKAEKYFKYAIEIFEQLPTVWGYSALAYGYISLIMLHKEQSQNSCMFLKKSDQIIDKYPKKYWKGLIYWIKGEISEQINDNYKLKKLYKGYLTESAQFYRKEAYEIFENIGTSYEKQLLNN